MTIPNINEVSELLIFLKRKTIHKNRIFFSKLFKNLISMPRKYSDRIIFVCWQISTTTIWKIKDFRTLSRTRNRLNSVKTVVYFNIFLFRSETWPQIDCGRWKEDALREWKCGKIMRKMWEGIEIPSWRQDWPETVTPNSPVQVFMTSHW